MGITAKISKVSYNRLTKRKISPAPLASWPAASPSIAQNANELYSNKPREVRNNFFPLRLNHLFHLFEKQFSDKLGMGVASQS